MPETSNDSPRTAAGSSWSTLADAIRALADDNVTTRRQLDHIDEMLHEVTRFIADNRAALDQATALLDPGRPMRAFLRKPRTKEPANAT